MGRNPSTNLDGAGAESARSSSQARLRTFFIVASAALIATISVLAVVDLTFLGQSGSERRAAEKVTDAEQRVFAVANCPDGPSAALVSCIADAHAVERQAGRALEDLQAQQDSARAAFWVIVLGGVQALLGVVGLLFIIKTMDSTAAAVKAAEAANALAREMGEAQVRAYLYCVGATFKRSRDTITAFVQIENKGQSPASDVSIVGDCSVHLVGGTRDRTRVLAWVSSGQVTTPCQPIGVGSATTEAISFFWDFHFPIADDIPHDPETRKSTFEGGNEVMFDLRVRWSDVFGRRHELTAFLHATVDGHPASPNKKRATSGKLHLRVDGVRHQIEVENPT